MVCFLPVVKVSSPVGKTELGTKRLVVASFYHLVVFELQSRFVKIMYLIAFWKKKKEVVHFLLNMMCGGVILKLYLCYMIRCYFKVVRAVVKKSKDLILYFDESNCVWSLCRLWIVVFAVIHILACALLLWNFLVNVRQYFFFVCVTGV